VKTRLIILFGSRITGTARIESDFDVAILADNPLSLEEKDQTTSEVAAKLNISFDKIDLVDISVASPLLQHSIAKTGKLISGEKEDFLRFKVLAWKKYLDTAKFRARREVHLRNTLR